MIVDVGLSLKRLGENAGPGTYDQAVVPDFLVLALDDNDVPRNVVPKVEGPPCHIFAQAQGLDTIIRPDAGDFSCARFITLGVDNIDKHGYYG